MQSSGSGSQKPVAVGMSGGTDSSMAAYLLARTGIPLVGITMRMWTADSSKFSENHLANAECVAGKLGIRHEVIDVRRVFRERIVTPFIETYRCGETPSPCIRCNALIKFGVMLEAARRLGCDRLATGHYARTNTDAAGQPRLLRGLDRSKDQSYFLFYLNHNQLEHALFPLGALSKDAISKEARSLGLIPHGHGESQDLCFIPDGKYAAFIAAECPELLQPGRIVTRAGDFLGEHPGYFHYTIGQRRGLNLGGGPWYVIDIQPKQNAVVVGHRQEAFERHVRIAGINWIRRPHNTAAETGLRAEFQLRYSMKPVPGTLRTGPNNTAVIELDEAVHAVTPGQAAVFYDGEQVLGGGWITRNPAASEERGPL